MAKVGRPPEPVPQDKAQRVFEGLQQGKSLRAICREDGMPSVGAVLCWAQKDPQFAEQYARAREVGLEHMAEEILEIADAKSGDTVVGEDGEARADHEWIQRSKLRVDTRKWILSKQLPRRYGERQQVEHSGGIHVNVVSGVPDAGPE